MTRVDGIGGRRKPPYYLSLAPLILWTHAERPIDWADRFGRTAPLELEIGFGNGESMVRRAKEQPGTDMIGLEIAWESTKRALRRLSRNQAPNVRLLQVDAHLALLRLFYPESLDRILSFFPIPWPKDRHAKRRIFNHEFLKLMCNRLKTDGQARIVTDYFPLAEWIETQTPATGLEMRWESTTAGFNTKYERKWQAGGRETFYDIRLFKRRHIVAPIQEDIRLQTFRLTGFDPDNFHPRDQQGELTVKFKGFFLRSGS